MVCMSIVTPPSVFMLKSTWGCSAFIFWSVYTSPIEQLWTRISDSCCAVAMKLFSILQLVL